MMGCLHLYSGDGKGKSTAAAGLALRALGRGKTVAVFHFLKGKEAGEDGPLRQLGAAVRLIQADLPPWKRPVDELAADAALLLDEAVSWLGDHPDGLLVCDELLGALERGVVTELQARRLLDARPEGAELVLTGRPVPRWLGELADYHTEMKKHRHPFDRGLMAREGVEY